MCGRILISAAGDFADVAPLDVLLFALFRGTNFSTAKILTRPMDVNAKAMISSVVASILSTMSNSK